MTNQFVIAEQTYTTEKLNYVGDEEARNPQNSPKFFFWFTVFVLTLSVVAYLVYSPEGEPELSPKRKAKRDAAIESKIIRLVSCFEKKPKGCN